jgi:hypothetical protein
MIDIIYFISLLILISIFSIYLDKLIGDYEEQNESSITIFIKFIIQSIFISITLINLQKFINKFPHFDKKNNYIIRIALSFGMAGTQKNFKKRISYLFG